MGFLRIGLLLLMILRISMYAQRWRGSAGKPVAVDGDSLLVHVIRDRSRHVRGARISFDVSDQFRFTLRPETSTDRFAKRFGIAREWQTGDELFDFKVFILSEDSVLLEAMSADRELRALISTLMDFHFGGTLECANGKLTFSVLTSGTDRDASDELLREEFARRLHPTLKKLRDRLARMPVGDWQSDRDPALRRKAWLVGVSTALCVAGVLGFFVSLGYDRHQIAREIIPRYAAWVTSGIGAALLAAAFLWLWRSPHTHAVLLDVLFAALPGVWLASNAFLTWYNEHYDAAAAVPFVAKVEQMYTSRHRNSTNYHLVVSGWPDAQGTRDVVVREGEYSMTHVDGCVLVHWHPGRLGDGWISGFGRANTENCDGGLVE